LCAEGNDSLTPADAAFTNTKITPLTASGSVSQRLFTSAKSGLIRSFWGDLRRILRRLGWNPY
jgi:hypothetical protein